MWQSYERHERQRAAHELALIERERARIRSERQRREISFSLIVFGGCTAASILVVGAGFWLAPKGGGYFAIALTCWIAGGAYALLSSGFLAFAIRDALAFIKKEKRS
jgi:hypothetical protein